MVSHYLFFKPKDSASFIDVLKPRQRPGEKVKAFNFNMRFEERYGELALYVMNDEQRQRIRGESREPQEGRPTIYTINDMVTADLVDFTSKKLEPNVHAFRADFFSPVRREPFAYATPYGKGSFARQMKERKGLDLEMLKFVDYKIGDPVESAVKSTFSTFDLAVLHNKSFQKYQGRGLALIVPARLIERE
ncbi:MAG: hypothetical protein WCK29_00415 [archaeon]